MQANESSATRRLRNGWVWCCRFAVATVNGILSKTVYGRHSICVHMHPRSPGVEEPTVLGERVLSRCSNANQSIVLAASEQYYVFRIDYRKQLLIRTNQTKFVKFKVCFGFFLLISTLLNGFIVNVFSRKTVVILTEIVKVCRTKQLFLFFFYHPQGLERVSGVDFITSSRAIGIRNSSWTNAIVAIHGSS